MQSEIQTGSVKKTEKTGSGPWLKSQQGWTWRITISWMLIANLWPPFGLYGFVCMFTPIVIALSGKGKMSCARICPRGSFIGTFTRPVTRGGNMPQKMHSKAFRLILWAVMMGSFIVLMIWAVPKGVYILGKSVLIFMEAATLLAFLAGVFFKPRSWCTICPMGYTSGNIRDFKAKRKAREHLN